MSSIGQCALQCWHSELMWYVAEAQHKESIVDSIPQSLLEGRPGSSLLLTPHQLQQIQQQLTAAGEGGGVTVTLQHGQAAGQLVLAPQAQFYPEIHTTHSILHHHVRQASIIQQVGQTSIHHQQMGMGVGGQAGVKPGSPFSSRSLTPSPSAQQRVVTPQPLHQMMQAPPQVLQIFQQATRNTVTGGGMSAGMVKAKQPPQILPKPPGAMSSGTPTKTSVPQPASSPQISIPTQQQQTILFNQMIPSGPMLVQQQTSSGVQLILRSPPPAAPPKQNTVVLSNGSPTMLLQQNRQQTYPQLVRLVSGQTLQLQQIQTSSGPAIIAVPTSSNPTPPPQPPQPQSPTLLKKNKKKKKKEEEPTRLDLANLMKLSGIEDEDMAPVSGGHQQQAQAQPRSPSPAPAPPPPPAPSLPPPDSPKHQPQQASHLVAQLQAPSQLQNQGLRVSVSEDGRMILHQSQPQVSGTVTPSIAAAAQSQLAQLLAHHGEGILQNNSSLAGAAGKDSAALLQSLQTAVLSWANTDSLVMKTGTGMALASPQVLINTNMRRPTNTPTSVVVANPTLLDPSQNGMRIVTTDLNGIQQPSRIQVMPTVAPRVQIVSDQQNRVQIVNSLSEQQNRVQIVNSLSEQQNRLHIVSNSLSEQQNRLQIVTSVPHSVSFEDQNKFHTIFSRAPSSVSLDQQNRMHIVSGVPTSSSVSLTEQQNRVQIVSGSQMSTGVQLTDQSRVQIVSGVPNTGAALSLTEQQNRVQIVSGVPNSTLTEQQNRVQIVSGIPSSSSMALTEQNRVQIVSGVANPSGMSLSEQNRVQIVSAVPHSSAMSLEQQNRVQIVSGVHSSSAMSMTEQQNRLQIVSGKALSLTERQNSVQIISNVQSEQQNRVQIVAGMPNTNSLSLEQQNRVQIVAGMPNNALSLAEQQQNRVQIVSGLSNSSVSCEQNRLQIINSPGIQLNESPTNRVQVVSAGTNTSDPPNRVQIVSGIPNRTVSSLDRIQLVQNDQSRVQVATSMPNLTFSDHQNRLHIISGPSNSSPVISEQNRVQIVTGVPNSNILSLSEQQSRVQIVSNTNHNSVSLPEQQRLQLVSGLSSDQTVQIVQANSDHCHVSSSAGHTEHQRLQVVTSHASSVGVSDQRVHIVSNDRLREPQRQMQSSGVQTVDQVVRPPLQTKPPSRSPHPHPQYQPTVISPRGNASASPQSPRGGTNKSPVVFPASSPQHQQQSPQQQSHPPKPTFTSRPNLTVVTQTSPSYQPPITHTSQPQHRIENHTMVNHFQQFPNKTIPTSTSHLNHQMEGANHPSVITSLASCQTTTAITKPLQAVTRQPPTTTSSPSSCQNSFLDSIAQNHPNIVINKSPTPPIASKALKPKKLPKKSAVVKPMMHEERQGVQPNPPPCEKELEPPSLVPISSSAHCDTSLSPNNKPRVQTIQLSLQKQQHLKAVQNQLSILMSKKVRTPQEIAAINRLNAEQNKILLSGKLIPTVHGQHAQGITFHISTAPARSLPPPTSSPRQLPPPPPPPPPATQPQHPPPPTPIPHPIPIPHPLPTVSKATSPIHVQVGTQTSCEPSPSPPSLSQPKRAALIDQQQRADRQGAVGPDVHAPFCGTSDAVKRLVRYHSLDEPVFSESDLHKADEIFESTSRHLLDKNQQMLNKYKYLLMLESMREVQTSELIMLGRMFISDETARLEAAKIEANAPTPPVKKERDDKTTIVKREVDAAGNEQRAVKREREDTEREDGVSGKKHCGADDEEINAQVQNAIDSILNLGSNRTDPALDEAVRSILT